MFKITYSRQAIKGMMRLQPARRQAVIKRINAIAASPFTQYPNVARLAASQAYRLRVGDWRVIYEVDRKTKVMHVVIIAPRGRAYR
ncbi:MAG: type II toxin-antitoxin system RelE/ParE family toxin [Proteobacteria bacterium]|nr:type II toxin-antitoxin system RelE/ParE family toxin [Pseudomonadota bacterium]